MQSRRACFRWIGAGILGAGLTAPAFGQVTVLPSEQPLLEILYRRSPFVFAVEITGAIEDEIADGEASTVFHTRLVKVLAALRGEKPTKEVHVSMGRFAKQPKFNIEIGQKLILFLTPFAGAGALGESTKPYVTVDHWFGVMPHSEALIAELKKFPPPEDALLKDAVDPTPVRHNPIK